MKREGVDRREGQRRSRWVLWLIVGGLAGSTGASGWFIARATATDPTEREVIVLPNYVPALESLRLEVARLELGERLVVTERVVKGDSFPYLVASPPETLPAPPPITVWDTVYGDTLYVYPPPQIITIPVAARGFWDPETYHPSIGNLTWGTGLGILGYVLGGLTGSSARACVVINGEETCN